MRTLFILLSFCLVGCDNLPDITNKNQTVENLFSKTFFLGSDFKKDSNAPKKTVVKERRNQPLTMPEIMSSHYDSLMETKKTPETNKNQPISLKAKKVINLGEEKIKIFNQHGTAINKDEINSLRTQSNPK